MYIICLYIYILIIKWNFIEKYKIKYIKSSCLGTQGVYKGKQNAIQNCKNLENSSKKKKEDH